MSKFGFKILKKSNKNRSRLGVIKTPHGEIMTPAFIPVATKAAVKGLIEKHLAKEVGAQAVLANTYHLYLRPGDEVIKKQGGLHDFMNWQKPLFTDSGGFQVFSLGSGLESGVGKISGFFPGEGEHMPPSSYQGKNFVKITEDGAEFKSHIDGSRHFFTPERSIKIQKNLGADLIFAFDECTSPLDSYEYTKLSMGRTHRWAQRSLKAFSAKNQAMYGIIQGGFFKDLRIESAKFIDSMEFFGNAIGGSLGKTRKDMYKILDWTIPLLAREKPRHLLGIGSLDDVKKCVERGIDTFDCVEPTRLARHGIALLERGRIDLKKSRYLSVKKPIDSKCRCYCCRNFRLSYLSHLVREKEINGIILLTIHNLFLMESVFQKIRESI